MVETTLPGNNSSTDTWLTPSGEVLATTASLGGSVTQLTTNVFRVSRHHFFDVTSKRFSARVPQNISVDNDAGCDANTSVMGTDSAGNNVVFHLSDSTAGVSWNPVSLAVGFHPSTGSEYANLVNTIPEGQIVDTSNGTLKLIRWDGSQAWSLSSQIVRHVYVEAGWLVVENQSDAYTLVDPSTGTQTTGPTPWLNSLLVNYGQHISRAIYVEAVDPAANSAVIGTTSSTYYPVSYSDICR